MALSRRGFLGVTGTAASAALVGLAGWGFAGGSGTPGEVLTSRVPLPRPFRTPLPVLPVARPVRSGGDTDMYEIVQREARAEILPGLTTPIFGYDGIFPGPTIVSRRGRRTVVRHRNELPVPAVVHLHGGHTPAASDGFPTDLLLPQRNPAAFDTGPRQGWSFHRGPKDYVFPMDQRAATLWYHDHRMDFTGPQVYRGLAGFHLIHDDEEDALPLPRGEKDIPLMILDRAFEQDGSFRYPSLDPSLRHQPGVRADYMEGVLGDTVLVNGAPWPELEVSNTKYRFRLLNASNARRYLLTLDPQPSDGASFVQVGSDGGLLEAPVTHRQIPIAPAERFDVVIDFSRYPIGTEIRLRNAAGEGATREVMRFRVTRRESEQAAVPARLSGTPPLVRSQAVTTREFDFRRGRVHGRPGWTINGYPFDPNRMLARPRLGDTEVWRFTTDFHHPVHLHLVQYRVVSRNGGPPRRSDVGWKDTVDVGTREQVEVLTRFTGYRGRYVFHCHNLEHEDMMMMAAFETV